MANLITIKIYIYIYLFYIIDFNIIHNSYYAFGKCMFLRVLRNSSTLFKISNHHIGSWFPSHICFRNMQSISETNIFPRFLDPSVTCSMIGICKSVWPCSPTYLHVFSNNIANRNSLISSQLSLFVKK